MTPEQTKTREFQESRDGCAERERTAATLLAALVVAASNGGDVDEESAIARGYPTDAVALADALRKALVGE